MRASPKGHPETHGSRFRAHVPMRASMRVRLASLLSLAVIAALVAAAAADARPRPKQAPRPARPGAVTHVSTPVAHNLIPAHIGRQGRASFVINRSTPAGVDPARFVELAAGSGARWGLRSLGETTARPLVADRVNTVGFSSETEPGALGVQRDVVETVRHRRTGRVLRRVVVDQDLALAVDVAWQQGPAHPGPDQFDLETVLIHELGHMAGNKDHAPLCSNSPLVASAAPGEWWRSESDYRWIGCGATLRSAGASVARGPIRHEVVRITRWVG